MADLERRSKNVKGETSHTGVLDIQRSRIKNSERTTRDRAKFPLVPISELDCLNWCLICGNEKVLDIYSLHALIFGFGIYCDI